MLAYLIISLIILTLIETKETQITYHNPIKSLSINISYSKQFIGLENSSSLLVIQNDTLI